MEMLSATIAQNALVAMDPFRDVVPLYPKAHYESNVKYVLLNLISLLKMTMNNAPRVVHVPLTKQ